MSVPAPPIIQSIDTPIATRVANRTLELLKLKQYAQWEPPKDESGDPLPDPGLALVHIFARLSAISIERINQTPEKNFLAFLGLFGQEPRAPESARVPLTFQLAAGSVADTIALAGTVAAAAPPEGEADPVLFETERDLVVTRTRLVAVRTREPGRDLYADYTAAAMDALDEDFPAFIGNRAIEHDLLLGAERSASPDELSRLDDLFGREAPKTITLHIRFSPPPPDDPRFWLEAMAWSYFDGETWSRLESTVEQEAGLLWSVMLSGVPQIPEATIHDRTGRWLRGRLTRSLPRGEQIDSTSGGEDVRPDKAFADSKEVIVAEDPFRPFEGQTRAFYVASQQVFSHPRAKLTLKFEIVPKTESSEPSDEPDDLKIGCEYWDGRAWQVIGCVPPDPSSSGDPQAPYEFSDATAVFTQTGVITFRAPSDWTERVLNEESVPRRWLRFHIQSGGFVSGADPVVKSLDLGKPTLDKDDFSAELPQIESIYTSVKIERTIERDHLMPDLAYFNQTPVDASKDVLPFGEKPKFNDALNIASGEAFSLPKARITLNITLSNPADSEDPTPIPPVKASPDLALSWEALSDVGGGQVSSPPFFPPPVSAPPDQEIDEDKDSMEPTGKELPGRDVIVEELFPRELDFETITQPNGSWRAHITGISRGLNIYCARVFQDGVLQAMRFWTVFRPGPNVEHKPIELQPDTPAETGQASITFRGSLDLAGEGVAILQFGPSDFIRSNPFSDGKFTLTYDKLEVGRNDLLIYVRDTRNQRVAAKPVVVNRTAPAEESADSIPSTAASSADADDEFTDATNGLTRSGDIGFTLSESVAPATVGGQENFWIRTRITFGNYGLDAKYEPLLDEDGNPVTTNDGGPQLPIYQLTPPTFCPPSIKSIKIGYKYQSPPLDFGFVLTENDFRVADHSGAAKRERVAGEARIPFPLFERTRDTHPALYLGFERTGSDIGFANRTTDLFFSVGGDVSWSALHANVPERPSDVTDADRPQADIAWEYRRTDDWPALAARDESLGLRRWGLLTFIGPADLRRGDDFGMRAFWIRGRLMGQRQPSPQLRLVLTNTMWAAQTVTVENEILGSSGGQPNQAYLLNGLPAELPRAIQAGESTVPTSIAWARPAESVKVEVRQPGVPTPGEIETLQAELEADNVATVPDEDGQPREVWLRWQEVANLRYESTPVDRHYTVDRRTGQVRFGDGNNGRIPPAAKSNIRATYRTSRGAIGNRPAQAVNQLKNAVPYVDSVMNFEPASGGVDFETTDRFKVRAPQSLRHQGRAVALADFEDLAIEATREVARAKAVGPRGEDEARAGIVDLIIVADGKDPQPIPSLPLIGKVSEYIQGRMSPVVTLRVAGPDWLRVSVTAELVPVSFEDATNLRGEILARLTAFLHPLHGGPQGDGWDFGRLPRRSDLIAVVERTAGVDYLQKLEVTWSNDDDEEIAAATPQSLIYSGNHRVTFVPGVA